MRPDFGPHFLIATEAEAAVGADAIQLDGVNGFDAWQDEAHGLGPEELAVLQCLLRGQEADMSVLDDYEETYASDEMHGPWLVRLPEEFVTALGTLERSQLNPVAQRWLEASENFRFRGAPLGWIHQVLEKLAELARRAVSQGKAMYLEIQSC